MDSNPPLFSSEERVRERWLWAFLAVFGIIYGLLWLLTDWEAHILEKRREKSPFLQVTNREFSLFLWQNPQWMRVNQQNRLGYLLQFSSNDDVHVIPEFADSYVSAPMDILYHYHTWKRLLGKTWFAREMDEMDFRLFLRQNPEWTPEFWIDAPVGYRQLVASLDEENYEDLNLLPFSVLPLDVRMAYQGWRNYFYEWLQIKATKLHWEQMDLFLSQNPTFRRPFWRNLLEKKAPHYLKGEQQHLLEEVIVPENQIVDFLRIGFYNWKESL